MKQGDRVPRPRKYDYTKDYPVTIFANLPVHLINKLESIGYKSADITREIDESLILIKYFEELLEKTEK